MKILNLYAGIGGNRKLWGDEHEITAVEYDKDIANIYSNLYPKDIVIITDAHQYLLDHYKEFDFIWSSPPCQSNSRIREAGVKAERYSGNVSVMYHDLSLYQEVLLMQRFFYGKFVVENVEPFYTPLIPAVKVDRHLFWANFRIGNFEPKDKKKSHETSELPYLADFFDVKLSDLPGDSINKRQILRNCVHPETGRYILDCALGVIRKQNDKQTTIFD